MPVRPVARAGSQAQLYYELAARDGRMLQHRSNATPELVDATAAMSRYYPWMQPGVVTALAQAGVQPGTPQANAIAERAAKLHAQTGTGNLAPGTRVTPAQVRRRPDTGIKGALKSFTRGAFTALEAPVHEVRNVINSIGEAALDDDPGFFGDAWDNFKDAPPSAMSVAKHDFQAGREVDLGTGWLPGGTIRDRVEHSKHDLQLDGTFVTPGRLIPAAANRLAGRTVLEPGSRPYSLLSGMADFAVTLGLDPATYATAGGSKIAAAKKTFATSNLDAVGAVVGRRKTTLAERASQWLDSPAGDAIAMRLAATSNVTEIKQIKGMSNSMASRIAEASDPVAVKEMLRPELGLAIRETPTLGSTLGNWTREHARKVRWLGEMPGQKLLAGDMDGSYTTLQNFYRTAKLEAGKIDELNAEMVRLRDGDSIGLYDFMRNRVMPELDRKLSEHGALASERYPLTRMFLDTYEQQRAYWVNSIGGNHVFPGVKIDAIADGRVVAAPDPHLISEYINSAIPLPDARKLRQVVTNPAVKFLLQNEPTKLTLGVLESFVQDIWKPMALLRGAYTVRVVGEEQVRMGAAGLNSGFTHPLHFILWRTGRRGNTDVSGNAIEDAEEFIAAMARAADWKGTPGAVFTGGFVPVAKGHRSYMAGIADELAILASDPVVRRVASDGLLDGDVLREGAEHAADLRVGKEAIQEWFFHGSGRQYRDQLATTPEKKAVLNRRMANRFDADEAIDTGAGIHMDKRGWLDDPLGSSADEYIDSVYERVREITGGHPELMDVLRTGRVGDIRIANAKFDSKAVESALERLADHLPEFTRAPQSVFAKGKEARQLEIVQRLNTATDWMFDQLMTKRTNNLSRSPAFKQYYWQRMEELVGFMDEATAAATLRAARKANLDKGTLKRMQDAAGRGSGELTDLSAADVLAKKHGLDETKGLLYDLSKKSQFADITRLIFPFAEAWKEFITTWSRLAVTRPQVARRGQQIIEGARASNPLNIISGDDPAEGPGFFFPDPQSGEEMFAYPLEWISNAMFGDEAGFQFTAASEGLNLAAGGPLGFLMPGVGPLVQVPVSLVMPHKPGTEWVRRLVVPFGEPDWDEGVVGGAAEMILPPWMKRLEKVIADPESDRLFANTVFDVMRAEQANENVPIPTTQEEVLEQVDSATSKARAVFAIRAVAQFFAPSAPQVRWQTKDFEGTWWHFGAVGQQFAQWEAEHGSQAAVAMLVETFGIENLGQIGRKTYSVQHRSAESEAAEFERANPEVFKLYPDVAGYFAPDDGFDDFDYQAYERQLKEGSRVQLTPRQMQQRVNQYLGRLAFENANQQVEAAFGSTSSAEARAVLREARLELMEQFPGYGDSIGLVERAKPDEMIRQLDQALEHPDLAGSKLAAAARQYMAMRDQAMASAQKRGYASFAQAKAAAPVRAHLRDLGERLSQTTPEFRPLWERVFSAEMVEDDEGDAAMQLVSVAG